MNRRELLRATALAASGPVAGLAQAQGCEPMELGDRVDLAVRSGLLPQLHALLVSQSGALVVERYYAGEDENWGRPLGRVAFDASTLHDLRSVSKSITSLVYGIALERGLVPDPDARLLDHFPQYADLASDPVRARWTIRHVLDMTLGTQWDEELPYTNPANSEIAMEAAPDRYRFVLDRPVVDAPGTVWRYNGGCSAILGYLIARGSGRSLDVFAREALFEPLGIDALEWNAGRDGVVSAASGLRMRARDLAKIGAVVLAGGVHGGVPLVPRSWVAAITTPVVQAGFLRYAHHWYTSEQPAPGGRAHTTHSAMGNGGQRLFVVPALDLVVVLLDGHYNRPDQWLNPLLVLQRLVLASLGC